MSAELLLGARRRPRPTVAVIARHLACKCEAHISYEAAQACTQGLKVTVLIEARTRKELNTTSTASRIDHC